MPDSHIRCALFVDFDNVFGALLAIDEAAAVAFAEDPAAWLTDLLGGDRRWLVRRCYMNPNGSVANPSAVEDDPRSRRLYFSRYRAFFTKAGFEVIDCPALTQRAKNGADIRIALDVMDALSASTRYDEFILASGDSDFTPLLMKLRAADRRTTIVSASPVAAAFESVADRHFVLQKLLDLLSPSDEVEAPEVPIDLEPAAEVASSAHPDSDRARAYKRFGGWVARRLSRSNDPLHLASLADESRRDGVSDVTWFGHGTFTRALVGLGMPDLKTGGHWVWDASRHTAPSQVEREVVDLPDPVARLCAVLGVPRLPAEVWPHVYRALAVYGEHHEFNLTEATKWSRDWLADQGVDVGRNAFGYVVRGAMVGGASLKRDPSPAAEEIASAFVTSTLDRAAAAQLNFSDEESEVVSGWLGATVAAEAR